MCGMMGLLTDSTVPRLGELVYHTIGNRRAVGARGSRDVGGRGTSILQHKGSFRRFLVSRAVL